MQDGPHDASLGRAGASQCSHTPRAWPHLLNPRLKFASTLALACFAAQTSSITELGVLSMHASTRVNPSTCNAQAVRRPTLRLQQQQSLFTWPSRTSAGDAKRHQHVSGRSASPHPQGSALASSSSSSSSPSSHPHPAALTAPAFSPSASSPTTSGHVGVVIVDHGSRKSDSNAMLHEVSWRACKRREMSHACGWRGVWAMSCLGWSGRVQYADPSIPFCFHHGGWQSPVQLCGTTLPSLAATLSYLEGSRRGGHTIPPTPPYAAA